ncbi:MAG: glycosyl hydrolase [Pseudomonadota bacterium]
MKFRLSIALGLLIFMTSACSSSKEESKDKPTSPLNADTFSGLELRNLGPAFMSGRIADIAIHPNDPSVWYVAVGSGGVWRTHNSGTTWTPVFDKESSYSIGSVAIDSNNPNIIWVGTGENVGGRHVGYGDGIYRSQDGGDSWENMGLKESKHLSTIIIHPEDSNTLWVAAQGPLWSKGGERGLYKTTDGGKNWKQVLGDKEWTGVTDVVIDPRDPKRLYAATWQRHRNVAAYMGGGPESGLHRSLDGGETWEKLNKGLPKGNIGKIGLAISPQKPDVLYAALELDRRKGAVYRSSDRGVSWKKQSDTVSGGTGPHYYQELYASPHAFDRIYLADVRMQISHNGGEKFVAMKENHKHSDNHALAFREDDPDYLLVGTDGGLYESFDLGQNWRYIANLPLTQFYKVAVDDSEPFYMVYGGTQDNNTQGGPSRTDNYHGIQNSDWFVTLFGDGHQPATEPGNPNIVYSEWQQGNLVRVDRTTGEMVYIKPQPEPGEPVERFNWDAPILVSPHSPQRLYFASQRVWRSDNRGDSWEAISPDLTLNQERVQLPIMGKTWGWDAPWDLYAMSTYNTITSLAESPIKAGLIYAGTDDGLIQVTEDGGKSWRKIAANKLPGVPKTAFINDIKADLYDENIVYVALDNHKFGDLKPYLFVSKDKGRSWRSMVGDLPERHLVWRLVQDHVRPELFFAATEFGLFFTIDSGKQWIKLKGGAPTISFRDIAIQRRENDLVGASFGRGFWVLDDYSALREVTKEALEQEAALFNTRKAWWYIKRPQLGFNEKGSQGEAHYTAANPPFGAVFTYYLKEDLLSKTKQREKTDKKRLKDNKSVTVPSWDALENERRQVEPKIVATVSDKDGNIVRRIDGPTKKGVHRIVWDLRFPATEAIGEKSGFSGEEPTGVLAAPGDYFVSLSKVVDGKSIELVDKKPFKVQRMKTGTLKGAEPQETVDFWQEISQVQRSLSGSRQSLEHVKQQLEHFKEALYRTPTALGQLDEQLHGLIQTYHQLDATLNGHRSKQAIGEKAPMTVSDRLNVAMLGTMFSSYGPTPMHKRSLEIAKQELEPLKTSINDLVNVQMEAMRKALHEAGAPWIPGSRLY